MPNRFRQLFSVLLMLCAAGMTSAQTVTLHFNVASATLSEAEKATLRELQESIRQAPSIAVSGYTDADGSEAYNRKLSEQRAVAVKSYLVELGIEATSISIIGLGESNPAGDNNTPLGKQANRRVEVYITTIAMPAPLIQEQSAIVPPIKIPEAFIIPAQKTIIDPRINQDVTFGDHGTTVHVPAYAFVDKKGNLVKEKVELAFTEYKNAADMVFSGIPMTYHNGGEEMRFNSAGMFSLYGTSNGEEIFIRNTKELEVDYAIAKQQEDIAFYTLQDDDQWAIVEDIPKMRIDTLVFGLQDDSLILLDSTHKHSDYGFRLRRFNGEKIEQEDAILWDPKTSSQLLPGIDPGHSYPDIVRGLSVGDFGVYNCDQIYRIENKVNIIPVFVDQNGSPIKDGQILSLIDLKYNGAFSFDPSSYIQLDARGRNVLILFTKSNKIYLISEQDMAKQNLLTIQRHTFIMRDVTSELDSTEKLSAYLGLAN